MKILLVDDEIDLRDALSELIIEMGHEVEACCSVEKALQAVERSIFQLILSDVRMPGGSGLDLLRKIKCSSKYNHIDVVLLTGFGSKGLVQ